RVSTVIYMLSLHDALPICQLAQPVGYIPSGIEAGNAGLQVGVHFQATTVIAVGAQLLGELAAYLGAQGAIEHIEVVGLTIRHLQLDQSLITFDQALAGAANQVDLLVP